MFTYDQYELIDFGNGRKLERFGPHVITRCCPAAEGTFPYCPSRWSMARATYQHRGSNGGEWTTTKPLKNQWTLRHGPVLFELKPTDSGQVGLFPEQAENWDWLLARVRRAGRPLNVLNLFAYTGGSTLACAAAGAHVVHVDAATSAVAWARRNAALSHLDEAPIRWISEDVCKFVEREVRRGNKYDAVIMDPPTYGHGPRKEAWKINQHLRPLLEQCVELTSGQLEFFLVTCHSAGIGPADLEALLSDTVFGACQSGVQAKRLTLRTADGRRLRSGVAAKWPEAG